jgi:aspartate aminotransferase
MALINPGDGVLLPVPYWVTYPEQITLAEGEPEYVPIAPAHEGELHADDLAAAATQKSRGLILNSPSNPSGAVIRPTVLHDIARLALDRDLWVISDEIYNRLIYDDAVHASIAQFEGMRDRTILINGVSKSYAMTGWRIGYAAGPVDLIKAMTKVQSQSTSNPTSISQVAAEAALRSGTSLVTPMRQAFKTRHDWLFSQLASLPGFQCQRADGTFYLFPEITAALHNLSIPDDQTLAEHLLEKAGIAAVPGSAFGSPGHLRFSYATSDEVLKEAITRLRLFLEAKPNLGVRVPYA